MLNNHTQEILNKIELIDNLSYEELNMELSKGIDLSKKLGSNGWTVNDDKTPNRIQEWLYKIESQGESSIAEEYTDSEIENILERVKIIYSNQPEKNYLNRAIDNYYIGRYTESAMFFLAVLDYRLSMIMPNKFRRKTKQCDEGINQAGKDNLFKYKGLPITKSFLIGYYVPSFTAFAKRLFDDGEYKFEKGIEPPYLNRNWLMHGRMKRTVKKYECIQIIHAFSTLEIIEEMVAEDNNGQVKDENE